MAYPCNTGCIIETEVAEYYTHWGATKCAAEGHCDYDVFDEVYASHIMGIAKPSEAFFEHILQQEGWESGATVFIDDREANVASAAERGMHAFLYESFPLLQKWLVEKKMLPAR